MKRARMTASDEEESDGEHPSHARPNLSFPRPHPQALRAGSTKWSFHNPNHPVCSSRKLPPRLYPPWRGPRWNHRPSEKSCSGICPPKPIFSSPHSLLKASAGLSLVARQARSKPATVETKTENKAKEIKVERLWEDSPGKRRSKL